MTSDLLQWLYAIETAANDAGEVGDFDAQEFFCDWFAAVREQDSVEAERSRLTQEERKV